MGGDRDFDVVVFGATGFVGRLVASYLARHAPGGLRIGLAGRSEARLAAVRTAAAATTWPLVLADSTDAASLARLANAARVVVSTVGVPPARARPGRGVREGGHSLCRSCS